MESLKFVILVCFLFAVGYVPESEQALGVDVDQVIYAKSWRCLQDNGISFGVVRISKPDGNVDENAAATIHNAREAGINEIGGIVYPCYKCANPRDQIRKALDNLNNQNASVSQIWLAIMNNENWVSNGTENINFTQILLKEGETSNITIGIYTNAPSWQSITNNDESFNEFPLWYIDHDKQQNFTNFGSFGGWQKPSMKQYNGKTKLCGIQVNNDFYPSNQTNS